MLRFVIGPTGSGKTSYCTARFGIERMHGEYARDAVRYAKRYVQMLNANGFNLSEPRQHLVYTFGFGISVTSPDFGTRTSWELDATRLGFKADGFAPQFVYNGSTLIVDEMQSVFDSRNWQDYRESTSRYFEQCRKIGVEPIFMAQADNLGELRIRQLCEVTLIRDLKVTEDRFGEVTSCTWTLQIWDRYADFHAQYPRGGRIEKYTFHGNVFDYYDTNAGSERFYDGLEATDYVLTPFAPSHLTPEGVAEYVQRYPIITKKKDGKKDAA